ncbi:hypothetical protein [Streptomyces chartreusis]|uniref:hypothetical protein n=1 Tax=Streptomyces chartreusis TaxID=1969 RepID=UPI003820ECB5
MPRIALAHWWSGHPPGAELTVDDEELRALTRDGRVAEVLADPVAQPEPAAAQDQPADEAVSADSEAEAVEPEAEAAEPERASRRRR